MESLVELKHNVFNGEIVLTIKVIFESFLCFKYIELKILYQKEIKKIQNLPSVMKCA